MFPKQIKIIAFLKHRKLVKKTSSRDKNNLRVKSRIGHHIELLKKLTEYLNDEDILIISNEMRKKRNFDLYSGGILVSDKEALEYKKWLKKIVAQAEEYLNANQKLF